MKRKRTERSKKNNKKEQKTNKRWRAQLNKSIDGADRFQSTSSSVAIVFCSFAYSYSYSLSLSLTRPLSGEEFRGLAGGHDGFRPYVINSAAPKKTKEIK